MTPLHMHTQTPTLLYPCNFFPIPAISPIIAVYSGLQFLKHYNCALDFEVWCKVSTEPRII